MVSKPVKTRLKRWLWRVAQPVRYLVDPPFQETQVWSIGIYVGDSPLHMAAPAQIVNPVLTRRDVTDVRALFVADPFMLRVDQTWHMFFEVFNCDTNQGAIALATSPDGLRWSYRQVVLTEPFHLSYPYVFAWQGDYYMIPESSQVGATRLYRGAPFPERWEYVGDLLRGPDLNDNTPFFYNDRWWLFVETGQNNRFDTLRLFSADQLLGPWQEHPRSPVVVSDPRAARPAGRVLAADNQLIRFAQNCYPLYGSQVRAFEITDLSPTHYREQELEPGPLLAGSGAGWNQAGMHHIDLHRRDEGGWIACVDGWIMEKLRYTPSGRIMLP